MELETWLLADIEALNSYFRTRQISAWAAPESVLKPTNELKRLTERFRDEDYLKTRHSVGLFKLASAERIYQDACPHFEAIINQLLQLQGIEPDRPIPEFTSPDHELFKQLAQLQDAWEERWNQIESDLTQADMDALNEIEHEMALVNAKITNLYKSS